MTYVVTDNCIKCKYMDCIEVCPVDCFYEGENMLVIHPDECIDCGVCEPECPADAIKPDTEPGLDKWLQINTEYAVKWPNITAKKDAAGGRQGIRRRRGQVREVSSPRTRARATDPAAAASLAADAKRAPFRQPASSRQRRRMPSRVQQILDSCAIFVVSMQNMPVAQRRSWRRALIIERCNPHFGPGRSGPGEHGFVLAGSWPVPVGFACLHGAWSGQSGHRSRFAGITSRRHNKEFRA